MNPAARLLSLFTIGVLIVLLSACVHVPTAKELESARIQYSLGVQTQTSNPRQAIVDFQKALEYDPDYPEANNAVGLLLHVAFGRHEESKKHYLRALTVNPQFSDAKVNLANLYLDLQQYAEAIALYREVLGDMLYPAPFIAHNNIGWALYKTGEVEDGISHIKSALISNPKFCQGYRNLGIIYDEQSRTADACKQFRKFAELCPEVAEAHRSVGLCSAKLGDHPAAKKSFAVCVEKSGEDEALKDDCSALGERLKP